MRRTGILIGLVLALTTACAVPPAPQPPTGAPKTLPPTWTLPPTAPPPSPTPTATSDPTSTAVPPTAFPDPSLPTSTPFPPFRGASHFIVSLPGVEYTFLANTREGDSLLLGLRNSADPGTRQDLLLRLDPLGRPRWARTSSPAAMHGVLEASDGGIILINNWSLTKLGPAGDFLWHERVEYGESSQVQSYLPTTLWTQSMEMGGSIILSRGALLSSLDREGGILSQEVLGLPSEENQTAYWRTADAHWQAGRIDHSGFWINQGRNSGAAWQRSFDFSNLGLDVSSEYQEILGTREGGALFAAAVRYLRSLAPEISIWVVRLGQSGEVIWQKAFDGGEEEALVLHETHDGGFLILSSSGLMMDRPASTLRLIRIDGGGNILWDRWYGDGINQIIPRGVVESRYGGFLIAAQLSPPEGDPGQQELLLLQTDASGYIPNCAWLQIPPFDPPLEKIPETTLESWSRPALFKADLAPERTGEPWLEIREASQEFRTICD